MRKRVQKQPQVEKDCMQDAIPLRSMEENADSGVISVTLGEPYTDTVFVDTIIANTTDALIALDQDFRVRSVNPAATAALGISSADAVEHLCSEVLSCKNLNRMLLCGTFELSSGACAQGEIALTQRGVDYRQECAAV